MRNRLLNLFMANAKRGEFRAEGSTIFVYDVIVGSDAEAQYWGGVSPEAFAKAVAAIEGDITLRLNCPGGDVFAARAMVQALREHKGKITVHVDGYAASAASLLAAAGDHTVMAEGAFIMIHKAWTITVGNSDEHGKTIALLDQVDVSIAESYAARGALSVEDFTAAMTAETWYGPDAAIAAGLADEKVSAEASRASRAQWNMSAYAAPPAALSPALASLPVPPAPDPEQEAAYRIRMMRARLATTSV